MQKRNTILRLIDAGVVAVVRGKSEEDAVRVADALIEGGVVAIEITFSTPNAVSAIKQLSGQFGQNKSVIIGAGTVLDGETAHLSILAGAEFVVSPVFVPEVAEVCNLNATPYIPGCMTVTEIHTAIEAGVDVVKLFPAATLGPEFIKAIRAPFPDVKIMPTGGVCIDNMADWFDAGAVAVGGGGSLTKVVDGDYSGCTATARQWVKRLEEIRSRDA
ncbi:MAG: bifunctional 2-keto-4-hydroxyglutarate aldolase/2-keto-3-deoxy-6-phosphogluconate aldolase [Candidatus Ancillula sp.]|nr:bifunctional 2-keto-4-hydroxyglutarate aldolase/2-keto-3-deoxy-6-phosphogluconate aldolase [Candidatus Ancillula sp.]